jgi:hypothetical protein
MGSSRRAPGLSFAITAGLVIAAVIALVWAGLGGWEGTPDGCLVDGQCFCERDRGGLLRQPANTLSNLGFVAAGLAIAWISDVQWRRRDASSLSRPRPRARNRMTGTRFYPGFYAAMTALLGPGSMALHASLTRWGSVLDLVSMNVFIGFVFSYALVRWQGLGTRAFLLSFGLLNAVLLAIKLIHGRGSAAFGVLALASLAVELQIRRSRPVRADGRFLAAAALTFIASFGVWLGSHNDGPLCLPDSWLQGHAVWHLGCAASTLLLFFYMRSEREEAGPAA